MAKKKTSSNKKVSGKLEDVEKKAQKKVNLAIQNSRAFVDKEFKLAKKKIADAEKRMKQQIKKNPEKAAKVAAGVGVALGAVLGATAASLIKKKKKK